MQGEEKAEKDDKLCSSLPWILGETRLKKQIQGDMSNPREVHYKTEWKRAQDAVYWINLAKAVEKIHNILANKIACNQCSQDGAACLYRESDISGR